MIDEKVCSIIFDFVKRIKAGQNIVHFPTKIWEYKITRDQHSHQMPELMFLLHGQLRLYSNDQYFDLTEGHLCIIPPYYPHRGIVKDENKFSNLVLTFHNDTFSLHFAKGKLGQRPLLTQKYFFKPEHMGDIMFYYDKSEACYGNEKNLKNDFIVGNLISFLSLIKQTVGNKNYTYQKRSHRLKICLDLIESNISESQLSVKYLSQVIGCTPNYLSSLFSKEMGTRLNVYINEQRCRLAVKLLSDTSLLIEEIAWSTGYSDPAYFCRSFTKYKGISPQKYRKSKINDRPKLLVDPPNVDQPGALLP